MSNLAVAAIFVPSYDLHLLYNFATDATILLTASLPFPFTQDRNASIQIHRYFYRGSDVTTVTLSGQIIFSIYAQRCSHRIVSRSYRRSDREN